MLSTQTLQALGFGQLGIGGFLTSPLGILGVLVALALVVLVGRFFLKVAWRLVIIGIIIVGTIYILGLLGFTVL
jgi:hypothetical protein